MQRFGKNSTIKVGRRKLHIQTVIDDDNSLAIASIFDDGTLLFKQEKNVQKGLSENILSEELDQFHQAIVADVELLFYVAEKVKSTKHAQSRNKMGRLFLEKSFIDEAIEEFRIAIKLEPGKPRHYFDLGKAFYMKGVYPEAIKWLKIAAEHGPVYADIRFLLGHAFWMNHDFYDAVFELRKAVELNENYHQALFSLGMVLIDSAESALKDKRFPSPIERISQANQYIQRATQLSDEYNKEHVDSGVALLKEKQLKEALQELKAANPSIGVKVSRTSESEFFLKFMFGGLGKDEQMIDDYIANLLLAQKDHPDYADLHNNLGVAYLIKARNMFLRAIDEFREAIKINPYYEKAKKNLRLAENDGRGLLILLRAILK